MVDAWWVAVWVYAALFVGQRLWRARSWVPPEWPEADYGWKVTHLFWVPFHGQTVWVPEGRSTFGSTDSTGK